MNLKMISTMLLMWSDEEDDAIIETASFGQKKNKDDNFS